MEPQVLGDKNTERILDQSFPISHNKKILASSWWFCSLAKYTLNSTPSHHPYSCQVAHHFSSLLFISATAFIWFPSFPFCPTSTASRLYFPQRVFLILIRSFTHLLEDIQIASNKTNHQHPHHCHHCPLIHGVSVFDPCHFSDFGSAILPFIKL